MPYRPSAASRQDRGMLPFRCTSEVLCDRDPQMAQKTGAFGEDADECEQIRFDYSTNVLYVEALHRLQPIFGSFRLALEKRWKD
jgi:hypothetical protein